MISRKRFLLRWTLSTTLAWAVGVTILFGALTTWEGEWFFAKSGAAFVGGVAGMGVLIGLAQSWSLRGVLGRANLWLPATAVGALLGMLAGEVAYQTRFLDTRDWFNGILFILVPVALLQYLLLFRARSPVVTFFLWVLLKPVALTIAFVGGTICGTGCVAFLGPLLTSAEAGSWTDAVGWGFFIVAPIGFLFGVITGLSLLFICFAIWRKDVGPSADPLPVV